MNLNNFVFVKEDAFSSKFCDDIIQDLIDANLKITEKDSDRIGKNDMHENFKMFYPNKNLTILQLITSLKSKGILYSTDYRTNSIKGSFYSVKFAKNTYTSELENDLDLIQKNCYFVSSSFSDGQQCC